MIQIEYLPLVLTGIGIIVSIFYYASILRNANLQREKEFLQQKISIVDAAFYNNWRKLLRGEWSTFTEWLDYRDENPEIYGHFTYITMILNGVGLLLKKKAMDPDLLFNVYTPNMIIWTWEMARPVIEVWREAINYPKLYEHFEYLYNEAKKRYPGVRGRLEYSRAQSEIVGREL